MPSTFSVGLIISASAIAGTLFMTDSVNYLSEEAVNRNLGKVDILVSSPRPFNSSVFVAVEECTASHFPIDSLAPLFTLPCSGRNADTGLFESKITMIGFDDRLLGFGDFNALEGNTSAELADGSCYINEVAASSLKASPGHMMYITLASPALGKDDIYTESRGGGNVETDASVMAVVKNEGLGSLQLNGKVQEEATLFVSLDYAQKSLNAPNMMNAIVVSCKDGNGGAERDEAAREGAETVLHALNYTLGLADAGLATEITDYDNAQKYLNLGSKGIFFSDEYDEMLHSSGDALGIQTSPVLTYFVNRISKPTSGGGKSVAYSTVCGIDSERDKALGPFILNESGEENYCALNDNDVCLNNWTAERLDAHVGDRVTVDYTIIGERYALTNLSREFTVRYVARIAGKADDRNLMPEFPGLEGIDNCTDWKPPFPIDLKRITADDIGYWQLYRGTPKAFINLDAAREMWGCARGNLTGIKIKPVTSDVNNVFKSRMDKFLNDAIGTEECGILVLQPRLQLLKNAGGFSETNLVFMSFGGVIVISGILLFVLTISMLMEERLKEVGTLRALGMKRRKVALSLTAGGSGIMLGASLIGTIFGVGVGYLLVFSLNTKWGNIVENVNMEFHLTTESLLVSAILGFLVSVVALGITAFLTGRVKIVHALKKRTEAEGRVLDKARIPASLLLILGIILVLAYCLSSSSSASALTLYITSGFLLTSLLSFLFAMNFEAIGRSVMRLAESVSVPSPSLLLGMNYPSRKRLRSGFTLYIVSLVAFMMITLSVTTAVERGKAETSATAQGGGYDIVGECTNHIYVDLTNGTSRRAAGLDAQVFEIVEITQLKSVGQAGGTCTNLNRNLPPKLVGASSQFIEENGFRFVSAIKSDEDCRDVWRSLSGPGSAAVNDPPNPPSPHSASMNIPAIGDYNTVVWVYGLGIGSIVTVIDDRGISRELEIVGILDTSIFTGTFFISEESLSSLYPKSAGYGSLLFKTKTTGSGGAKVNDELAAQELEKALSVYGLDAKTVRTLVKSSTDVEQSYVEALQVLLGIGLIIGLICLGLLSLRTVVERRWDIGLMRSIGLRGEHVSRALMCETCYLLLLGLSIGTLSGISASALLFGSWAGSRFQFIVPWETIGLIWLVSFGLTIALTLWPSRLASRIPPAEALRSE